MSTQSEDGTWDFAGWGTASRIVDLGPPARRGLHGHGKALGTWSSTAICGNDITSSCLYVSALCAAQAGPYAPLVLLVVAGVLYLYRSVYAEVGSALPLNGGTYTLLLNTTDKRTAAAAAVLTLLSYCATAVISAGEAMHYAHTLWHGLPVYGATIGLLGLFALLNVIGITESAVVALGIFVAHMLTLTVLCIGSTIYIVQAPELMLENLARPPTHGIGPALFFGFAAAMLGISGFESSANFIEEQQTGVFPKTLRNMWIAVAVFNPLISLLSLGLLPLAEIEKVPEDLLAQMGDIAIGPILGKFVAVDAVLVLSGAVLTSYVGVTGLVRRMTLDRCLPQALLAENRWRHTNHWIIIGFFAICCSIFAVTNGEVTTLAGVYTFSFLAVMALFATGNLLLKVSRSRLPRETKAGWPTVVVALFAVVLGFLGNFLLDASAFWVFISYAVVAGALVGVMFMRVELLRVGLFVVALLAEQANNLNNTVRGWVRQTIDRINSQVTIYFTKGDDLAELNRAALYVQRNEQTNHMVVVHVFGEESEIPPLLADHLATIDRQYPNLRIDLLVVQGTFGPDLIDALSERLSVPKNYMFLGTPGDRFPHRLENLGGVRLIL